MAVQRSRLSRHGKNIGDGDRRPRLRLPLIPTLVGALIVVNIASAVLALME